MLWKIYNNESKFKYQIIKSILKSDIKFVPPKITNLQILFSLCFFEKMSVFDKFYFGFLSLVMELQNQTKYAKLKIPFAQKLNHIIKNIDENLKRKTLKDIFVKSNKFFNKAYTD